VLLPNGISTVFGPVSARVPDIGDTGVLQMSKLNDFLHAIQQNRQHIYQALGDGAYGGNLRCIRSYFQSLAGQPPLTDEQKKCNIAIKRCRQSIEWSYGKVSRYFAICSHPKHIMIGKRNPYAVEQLRVAHLLTNISTCLKGDQASGKKSLVSPATSCINRHSSCSSRSSGTSNSYLCTELRQKILPLLSLLLFVARPRSDRP
jgi:hypothetical protein